jgi:hypothetical protein
MKACTRDLTDLLDRVARAAQGRERVEIREILRELGDGSITPMLLVICVILISPISGIPGVPTLSALLVISLSVQALLGRELPWLPGFLLNRTLPAAKLTRALDWLRRPCAFVDRNTRPRLAFLTYGIMRMVTLLVCVIIPLGWPVLELVPFSATMGGLTVGLLVFGLFVRDGMFVLLGYGMIALTLGGALKLLF